MDRWMDRPPYRDVRMHLKNSISLKTYCTSKTFQKNVGPFLLVHPRRSAPIPRRWWWMTKSMWNWTIWNCHVSTNQQITKFHEFRMLKDFFGCLEKKKRNQEKYKNTTLGSMETWYEDYKKSSLIVWLTLNQLKYPSFQKVLYQYHP